MDHHHLTVLKFPVDAKISNDSSSSSSSRCIDTITTSNNQMASLNDLDGSPILIHTDTESMTGHRNNHNPSKSLTLTRLNKRKYLVFAFLKILSE